jgi:hypothetical protein
MEFLSYGEPEPAPGAQLTRTEALVVSAGVHLLLFLLVFALPAVLPDAVLQFFGGRPPPPAVPAPSSDMAALAQPAPPAANEAKVPLEFAYVKLPDDRPVEENPNARLLSDKSRRARQEVPTPPDVMRFTIDPHSEGDAITREVPDPTIPEGPDAGIDEGDAAERESESGAPEATTDGDDGTVVEVSEEGLLARREETDQEKSGGAISPGSGSSKGFDYKPSDDLRSALSDMKVGERKFTFRNPGFLRGSSYGTLSFDTQDFPCIAKGGEITEILTVRPSSVPPFNKAASDAIRASDPLPPLPYAFPEESEGVTFCFFYNMFPGEVD